MPMAGRGREARRAPRGGHKYPRSARVGETLREIIAEELVRIDDERLEFVTVTGIEVDDELNRAHVYFDSLAGEEGDAEIIDACRTTAIRLQSRSPPDPHQEDTDPRLPARRRAALGRADRRHPPRADREQRGPAPRRLRHRRGRTPAD
jgi:ribosome-binding factor A